MPFSFPPIEHTTGMPYEGRDVPLLEWGGNRFEQATTQTAGRRLFDFAYETLFDNSRILLPNEANRLYGIPEAGLTYDYPVREETARGRKERKERELLFQSNAAAATHGFWSAKAFATFPFAVAGQLTDPIELGINAIPFVGIGSRSAGLARLAGETVSPLAERGVLLSMESLAGKVRFPVLAGRMLEATAGNVVAEIPVAIQNIRDSADYEFADSLMNIALGGAFSASTHALSRALGHTRQAISKASEATRVKAFNSGIAQVARNEGIDVGREFALDKNVHLEQMRFDETAALQDALQSPAVRDAIKFEAMSAASDILGRIQAGDIEGAFRAAGELPLIRDVIGSGVDLGNSITAIKQAISALPDLGRIETDGRTLNQWIESVESGKSIEPTSFQKRSPEQLAQIAEMKRIPENIRQLAREAAETRRLNQEFAFGSPAERSYTQKLKDYVESKRTEFDSELRTQKQAEEAKMFLAQNSSPAIKSDLDYYKSITTPPAIGKGAAEVAEPEMASVKVRQMKDGKVVSGTVEMSPDAAIRGLSERLKLLQSLSKCLGA